MKVGITMEEEHPKLKDFKTCLKGSAGGMGLGVNGRGKTRSQSFGPEPFQNFRTGFYFCSAHLGLRLIPTVHHFSTKNLS